jgi:tetratricopeptide (TPR) repeat protein
MIMALWNLGALIWDKSTPWQQPELATQYMKETRQIYQEIGDRRGVAGVNRILGVHACHRHDDAAGRRLFEESLATMRELQDDTPTASLLAELARLFLRQGELEQARARGEEALALWRRLEASGGIANMLAFLGDIALQQDRPREAQQQHREALTLRWEILGNTEEGALSRFRAARANILASLEGIARVAAALGEPARSVRLFSATAALRDHSADPVHPMGGEPDPPWLAAQAQLTSEAFAAAWAEGQAMSAEAAVQHALMG